MPRIRLLNRTVVRLTHRHNIIYIGYHLYYIYCIRIVIFRWVGSRLRCLYTHTPITYIILICNTFHPTLPHFAGIVEFRRADISRGPKGPLAKRSGINEIRVVRDLTLSAAEPSARAYVCTLALQSGQERSRDNNIIQYIIL